MLKLGGKKILITGSSRGIGRACALELARNGADIAIHYAADRNSAEFVRDQISAMGRNCIAIQADLVKKDGAGKIMAELKKNKWDIDILILNASVQFRKNWQDIDAEDFNAQINCNLWSSLQLLQKLVPDMRRKKWGRIITIGSIHESHPNPDMLVYAASKAALSLMAKSLALKLAPDGITVNSIAPGVILTDRNAKALEDQAWHTLVCSKIPTGEIGQPRDCTGLVTLLCSESGHYISGQNIFVDGAFSAT